VQVVQAQLRDQPLVVMVVIQHLSLLLLMAVEEALLIAQVVQQDLVALVAVGVELLQIQELAQGIRQ
jgi:hypothetical protein